jgi:hypothetical protein
MSAQQALRCAQATKIERDDLKPALIGLSMVKGKMLLKKAPSGKEINDGDAFSFNEKFKSPHLKIKFAAAGGAKEARPCCCHMRARLAACHPQKLALLVARA